jgi:hypothetical protein
MDYILQKAQEFHQKQLNTEILTVDNHADAAYLYLKLKEKKPNPSPKIPAPPDTDRRQKRRQSHRLRRL